MQVANLILQSTKNRKNIQGKEISMIFQDSGSALNPLTRVGKQIQEVLKIHKINSKDQRKRMTMDLLGDVGFPDPQSIYRSFPHELSGGMRQRIMICMALIAEPDLIIADEPTTALDTTIQKQILDILYRLIREKEKSMIIITHDWGVINEMCDRVYVMYAGKVVEEGSVEQIVHHPRHSYTKALLKAIPSLKSKGHPLFYIPFKVSSITDRRHGEWPYLEFSKSNEEYIRKNFPEFIIEEYKSSKTASGNSKDDNKDKLTRSLAQDSKEEKSNGHASLPNYSDKAKADTIIHQVPDLPNLNNKSVKEKRDLEED